MMEISRAVEHERRQLLLRFVVKFFDQTRRSGETQLRPPGRNIQRPEGDGPGGPGIIQVEMNRLAQDSKRCFAGGESNL